MCLSKQAEQKEGTSSKFSFSAWFVYLAGEIITFRSTEPCWDMQVKCRRAAVTSRNHSSCAEMGGIGFSWTNILSTSTDVQLSVLLSRSGQITHSLALLIFLSTHYTGGCFFFIAAPRLSKQF